MKSAIVQVGAAPFRQWYEQHYGQYIGRKKKAVAAAKKETAEVGRGKTLVWFILGRGKTSVNISFIQENGEYSGKRLNASLTIFVYSLLIEERS